MKKITSIVFVTSLLIPFLAGCTEPRVPMKPEPTDTSIQTPVENIVESPADSSTDVISSDDITVVITDSNEDDYRVQASAEVDLNGDGKKDTVVLKAYKNEYGYDDTSEYDLFVNEIKINEEGESINPMFNIVDIKRNDKYLEIAVSEEGPSADYKTTFFRYNGEELKMLGRIQGYYGLFPEEDYSGDMIIDGSGTIITYSRGEILQTWFYEDIYELRENDELVNIRKDLYPMKTDVTMLKDLKTVMKRDSQKEAFTLKAGEKATIMETDNKSWVSIKNAQGDIGWFYTQGYDIIYGQDEDLYPTDYFEGLSMAD